MDNDKLKLTKEQALISGGVLSALGGIAFAYSRRHDSLKKPNPEILNDSRLSTEFRDLLNMAAVHILRGSYVSRDDLIKRMDLTKHRLSPILGYLQDNGLVHLNHGSKNDGVPVHFEATQALAETLRFPEVYPQMAVAIETRAQQQKQISESS